ncbi:MAG: DivIVA domain-containing protein [Bacillota bacterium]
MLSKKQNIIYYACGENPIAGKGDKSSMSLSPIDIQNKEFSRSIRGYKADEVDEFMEQLAKDFEVAIKEKMSLEVDKKQLEERLAQYRKLEDTLHNAIIVAQETAEDVKRNANREAELIRREAEKEAQRIVEEARYKASRIMAEHEEVLKQAQIFKLRFRSFVEAQLACLELEDWLNLEQDDAESEGSDLT